MTSKEKVQYNDDEEVNGTYNKIIEKAAVGTGYLDAYHKPWYLILTLPLRIAEFVTTLLLFGIIVYLSTEVESGLRNTTTIFMITLTTSYLFFACIQIIAHFTGSNLPEYPFVFFNFLGMCFYTAAAFSILYTAPTKSWGRLASFLLCFLIGGFHTASILIVLIFWRERFRATQKYSIRGPSRIYPTHMLYSRGSGGFDAANTCQCEIATSVSRCGVLEVAPDDAAIEAHGSRRVETGHRRSYVDKHCSCPEIVIPKVTEVQTECGKISTEETQTFLEVKETIIQTLSKCELCNRQMIEPEPTPVTPVPSEEIPPECPSVSVILGATQSTPPTQSIFSPSQIPKVINQATQSGCIMPCPNASPPTPFYIIPGGLGLRDGMNPCCGACNCGNTSQMSSQLQFCSPKEPEPKPLPPPPPPPPPVAQPSWTATCETRVIEPGPCEKSLSCDRDLVIDPGDKTARIICPGVEPGTQKLHRIKIATKVGPGTQQMIDCHSSSIIIRKNKKTQTKVKTYVCASEESSDEKDDKKPCRCRRVLHVKSQMKDGSKMQQIDEDYEGFCKEKGYCGTEQVLAITESSIKTNKRMKPLYRELIEEKKSRDDSKSDNDKEKTEKNIHKKSKSYDQGELNKEIPRRFKSKVSPSPSQTRPSQVSKKSEEILSKPAWQRSSKDNSGDDNTEEDATVRIEDVTNDNQRHSIQSPVNYPPPNQSRTSRESKIDQFVKAFDKEPDEVQNEFPEEF